MKIYDIREPSSFETGLYSVALGRFDGVHKAHMMLISEAKKESERQKSRGVMTAVFMFSENANDYITDFEQKTEIFETLGVDAVFTSPFEYIRNMSPEQFVNEILVKLGCTFAVCGYNYRFGVNASGNADLLSSLLLEKGIGTYVVKRVCEHGYSVSSTCIRALLQNGDVDLAGKMLGRNFSVRGEIIHGYEKGRKFGFPTLNVKYVGDGVRLKNGVYISLVTIDGRVYRGVTNIGKNPTLPKEDVMIETHLLGTSGDFYGKVAKIELLFFVRPEKHFESISDLADIIRKDVETVERFFIANEMNT